MVKAKCPDTKSIVDALSDEPRFNYSETNEFHKVLKDLHMIVDDDVNEMSLLNYYFFERNRDNFSMIIFVTRQCNFQCTYCYEEHEKQKMDSRDYQNLLIALEKEIEHKRYKTVTLSFFGGEPLLEFKAICEFMRKAKEMAEAKEIQIYGSMTTNAYLLSLDRLAQLVELNITHYQITVDGLREAHDKNRHLAGGRGTWETIIKNLLDAKNSSLDFVITIRTNFDLDLSKDFKDYLEFLSMNFAGDGRFNVHFEAVKNLTEKPRTELVAAEEESDITIRMARLAKKLNLNTNYSWNPFSGMCYASRINNLNVDANGTLLKCTVRVDSEKNFVGKLTNEGFEIEDDKICQWTSCDLPKECSSCIILPLCFGRKCPITTWGSTIHDPVYCKTHISLYEEHLKILFLEE
jgi:uncharacterized protein